MAVLNKAKKKFSDLLHEKDFTLWEILEQIKKRGLDIWVPLLKTDKGSHAGFPHLQSVEDNANLLVPDKMKEDFTAGEIFLLLSSIFLHDIGRIENEKKHNEVSYRLIKEHWAEWGLPDERIAEYCAIIALFHGINEPESKVTLPQKKGDKKEYIYLRDYYTASLKPYGNLRIPLLAVILRVADETDNHWKRAIREFIIRRSEGKRSELIKWFRNFIDDVEFCPEGECILLHIPKNKLLSKKDRKSHKAHLNFDPEEIDILNNSRRDIAVVLRNWKPFLAEYDLKFKNVFFDYNNCLLSELIPEELNKPNEKLQQTLDNARREFMYPPEPVVIYYYLYKIHQLLGLCKKGIINVVDGRVLLTESSYVNDRLLIIKDSLQGIQKSLDGRKDRSNNKNKELEKILRCVLNSKSTSGEVFKIVTGYAEVELNTKKFLKNDIRLFLNRANMIARCYELKKIKTYSKKLKMESKYLGQQIKIMRYFNFDSLKEAELKLFLVNINKVIRQPVGKGSNPDIIIQLIKALPKEIRGVVFRGIKHNPNSTPHEMVAQLYEIMFRLYRAYYNSRDTLSENLFIINGKVERCAETFANTSYKFSSRLSKATTEPNLKSIIDAIVGLYLGSLGNRRFSWNALEAETGKSLQSRDKWLVERINLASPNVQIVFHDEDRLFIRFDSNKLRDIYKELGAEYEKKK